MSNKVTIWKDLSGKGNHAVGSGESRPEYVENGFGNNPTLRFGGEGLKELSLPVYSDSDVLKQHTYFIVLDIDGYNVTVHNIIFMYKGAMCGFLAGSRGLSIAMKPVVTTSLKTITIDNFNFESGNPELITVTMDTNTQHIYINGVEVIPTGASNFWNSRPQGKVRNLSPNEFNSVDISEILLYNRVLTESERQSIENYLMTKYGIDDGS